MAGASPPPGFELDPHPSVLPDGFVLDAPKDKPKPKRADYSAADLAASKVTFGLSDKAAAAGTAGGSYIRSLFTGKPSTSYADALQGEQQAREDYAKANPGVDWGTSPLNFVAGGPAKTAIKSIVRAGIVSGAGLGGAAAAGSSRGTVGEQAGQIAAGAGIGAVTGGVAAKVVPLLLDGATASGSAIRRKAAQIISPHSELAKATADNGMQAGASAANVNPPGLLSVINKGLADQGQTPRQAAAMIDAARARGTPLALMDTGDELRGLAAGLSRKPGPSRTIVRDAVISRQEGQTERVQGAIARDLGPVTDPRLESERLIAEAQAKAKPHYEAAYAKDAPQSPEIDALMNRPSMQKATNRAYSIAQEEGRNPEQMGFDASNGLEAVKVSNPSVQTLDYVKRGLDDVVESHRDPVTGRLKTDEGLRAIIGTQRKFLGALDEAVPEYATARAAYAGPAKMTTALAKGGKALGKSAAEINAYTRDMTPAELDHFKLGFRSALTNKLDKSGDYADAVHAVVSTPEKRKALGKLFGGEDGLNNFLATLSDERAAGLTYKSAATGSPTAANLQNDGAADAIGGAAVRALKGQGLVHNAINTVADLAKHGSSKAAEVARAKLAAALTESDPAVIAQALREARRVAIAERAKTMRQRAPVAAAGGYAARVAAGLGPAVGPNQ